MRKILMAGALLASLVTPSLAADPGLYAGARVDAAATALANQQAPGGKGPSSVATTTDSFEKVMSHYKAAGTEMMMPRLPGQPDTGYERELPSSTKPGAPGSGIKVKQVLIILDGASDLATSKNWVAVTRPFIMNMRIDGDRIVYEDVRDVTVIVQTKP